MRLENKVAVVTGSSRGIGRAIAQRFAREGARLVITYRDNDEAAAAAEREVRQAGAEVLVTRLEASDRHSIKQAFSRAKEHFGRIDVLVNNAGINKRGFLDEITEEDWDRIMAVNLKGPFLCCQELFPHMINQKGGRIINIASVAGQYHGPKTVHYAVSKAGLICLTRVLARYGAEHGILVNAVAPGLILTDQTRDEINSPAGDKIIGMTLLKRAGELEDVASACVLLASDEQSYITGQVISVSGGAYLGS
jgi:3-oxoacyl-[acyl-carrier protein] reductase